MPLKVDDFSMFCCNWNSKSLNLRSIGKELNIGLDSIVFIDDNPVECAEVKKELPEVRVVEMTDDPSLFIRKIDSEHFFDQLDLTTEDLERSKSYLAISKITELRCGGSVLFYRNDQTGTSIKLRWRCDPVQLNEGGWFDFIFPRQSFQGFPQWDYFRC